MQNSRTNRRQVVSTTMLAEALEPLIERRMRLNAPDETELDNNHSGGLQSLSTDAAHMLGCAVETVTRRLFSIRNMEFPSVNVEIADALLEALDSSVRNEDIPVMAGTVEGAAEMIDGYLFAREESMNLFEEKLLAKKLHRFSRGFLAGAYGGIDGIVAAEAVGAFLKAYSAEPTEELAEAA